MKQTATLRAARLLPGCFVAHRSKTIAGILSSRIQPKFAAAPLPQSLTWCTRWCLKHLKLPFPAMISELECAGSRWFPVLPRSGPLTETSGRTNLAAAGVARIGHGPEALRQRILVRFRRNDHLVHQVSDWGSGAAANFDWMREAKRENTRCGL